MLRKYLLGKNVDYCTRVVISASPYTSNNPDDNMVTFRYSGVPISQICTLCYPFVVSWLRNFFERELIETQASKWVGTVDDPEAEVQNIKNPESFYNDTYIKKSVDRYVKDPSSRFDIIPVPLENGKKGQLRFSGRFLNSKADSSGIVYRPMTWTDLLFIACKKISI